MYNLEMFLKKLLSSLLIQTFVILGLLNAPTNKSDAPVLKQQVATTSPKIVLSDSSSATSTKTLKKEVKAKKAEPEKKPTLTIFPASTTPQNIFISEENVDFTNINSSSRSALINILCTTKYGDLSPISGTGVIINGDGLILTNAHIGQYLLLKDLREKNYISCVARTGSPAYPRYKLDLVFISPSWVADNKDLLKQSDPKGTGEHDYSFLRISEMTDGSNLPSSFPFIVPNIGENINKNSPVLLVSYPAGFLGGLSILQDLSITSATTRIQDVFTFKANTVDVIAVGGTVVSQKGSSGGAVIDKNGTLLGIITTSSDANSTSDRALNAITVPYINRELQSELKMSLFQFLLQDPKEFGQIFASTAAPILTKTISDELNKN